MKTVLQRLNREVCLIYFYDTIVLDQTIEEYFKNLESAVKNHRTTGLDPWNCVSFVRTYLSYAILA